MYSSSQPKLDLGLEILSTLYLLLSCESPACAHLHPGLVHLFSLNLNPRQDLCITLAKGAYERLALHALTKCLSSQVGPATAIVRAFQLDSVFVNRSNSIQIKVAFSHYQGKAEQVALLDTGATENFIDHTTVVKLCLGMKKLPYPHQASNVDSTLN